MQAMCLPGAATDTQQVSPPLAAQQVHQHIDTIKQKSRESLKTFAAKSLTKDSIGNEKLLIDLLSQYRDKKYINLKPSVTLKLR